jgi:hypothetical protein
VTLSAQTGIGSGDALETTIVELSAVNRGSGDIVIAETDGLVIDLAVTEGGNGNIDFRTVAGAVTVSGAVTAHGSGNVIIVAADGLLAVNAATGSGSGNISLTGGTGVTHSAAGDLTTTGAGTITVSASSGSIIMVAGTVYTTAVGNLAGGAIRLQATDVIALGLLTVTESNSGEISVVTSGDITDANDTVTVMPVNIDGVNVKLQGRNVGASDGTVFSGVDSALEVKLTGNLAVQASGIASVSGVISGSSSIKAGTMFLESATDLTFTIENPVDVTNLSLRAVGQLTLGGSLQVEGDLRVVGSDIVTSRPDGVRQSYRFVVRSVRGCESVVGGWWTVDCV